MSRIIRELDNFQILITEDINETDYQLILMLYQPIIGLHASNLFLTLITEKKLTNRINLDFNHQRLMTLLNIDNIELSLAIENLEDNNLLVTYFCKESNSYIYNLKKPLNAKVFFNNEKLNTKLKEKLNTLNFEKQKFYFLNYEPEITEDYVNITNNKTSKVSVGSFLNEINNNNFSEKEKMLNFKIYNKNNNLMHNKSNLTINTNFKITNNNNLQNAISIMQSNSCEQYISNLTKKPITAKLQKILNTLLLEFNLSSEVINCLIEYVWFKNNKRLEPNYILKIGQTFKENNIDNIEDALTHLKLAYSKSKKSSYHKTNSYEQKVLWSNDIEEETERKDTSESEISKNNIKSKEEIDKIIEEIVNW